MAKLSVDLAGALQEMRQTFGLAIKEESYSERDFGNALIVLVAPDFAVRIVRDRGDIFFDLAKPDLKWTDADKRIESLGLHPDPRSSLTLAQFLTVLRDNKCPILESL